MNAPTGQSSVVEESDGLNSPKFRLLHLLRRIQQSYRNHTGPFVLMLSAFFALWAFIASKGKLLWFDELLGLSASTAPRIGDVLPVLASGSDFNPPLYHYLARFSIELFGYSATAARLPAFVGMCIFLTCIFLFVSRRLDRTYGIFAISVILCMPVRDYAWEARPYGLVLCLTGIAMLAWQTYRSPAPRASSALALTVFALACGCLVATHYYGVLVALAFAGTELVVAYFSKRWNWPLLLASIVPPLAVLAILRNTIHSQRAALTHYHSMGNLFSFHMGYEQFAIGAYGIVFFGFALTLGLWLESQGGRNNGDSYAVRNFSDPELTLALMLCLLPVFGSVSTVVLHAYLQRYFLAASAGFAVGSCYILASLARRYSVLLLLFSVSAAFIISTDFVNFLSKRPKVASPLASLSAFASNGEPFVFQDAKDYLQAVNLNPQIRQQLFYVSEPELAVKLTGTDSDDRIMRALAGHQQLQVTTLTTLSRQAHQILVVPSSLGSYDGWLEACLARMGSDMRIALLPATHVSPGTPSFSVLRTTLPTYTTGWCEEVRAR